MPDDREVTRPTAVTKSTLTRPKGTVTGLSGRLDLRKLAEPLMTPGMQKHRRYVEKMKKKAAAEKLRLESDRAESWGRNQKIVLAAVLIGLASIGYWKVQ